MTDKGEMLPTDTWALAYWARWFCEMERDSRSYSEKYGETATSKRPEKSQKKKHLQGLPMIVAINYPYLLLKHLKVSA